MADTYSEIYYHFIWSTKNRETTITVEKEPVLHGFIRHKCAELDAHVYAVNGTENHIHLAASIPLTISISDFMKHLKGSSSYFLNHLPEEEGSLYWQQGFGVLTFAKRNLPAIVAYIDRQKERHRTGKLSKKMERFSD